jgi:hypothetical protein
MRIGLPPAAFIACGFVAISGAFATGLSLTLTAERTALPGSVAQAAVLPKGVIRVTVSLPDPVDIALPRDGGKLRLMFGVMLRATPVQLMTLQDEMIRRHFELQAMLVAETMKVAETTGSAEALRATLPDVLRQATNAIMASDGVPEPVEDILILEFLIR